MKISVIVSLFVGLVTCANGFLQVSSGIKAPKDLVAFCSKQSNETVYSQYSASIYQPVQICAECCAACLPVFPVAYGGGGGIQAGTHDRLSWLQCTMPAMGACFMPSPIGDPIAANTACVKQKIIEPPKNLLEICPHAAPFGGPIQPPNLDCKRSSVVPYQTEEFQYVLIPPPDQVLPCQECCTACRSILNAIPEVGQQQFNASGLNGGQLQLPVPNQVFIGVDEQKNTGYALQAWLPCMMAGLSIPSCTATFARPPWETMKGCCREHIPGAPKRKRYLNHHDTLFTTMDILGGSMADATATCKEACENAGECTAVEVHASKKTKKLKRNKNKRQKKTSKGFTCELHTANINSASRKSKTCKKAKCFTLGV